MSTTTDFIDAKKLAARINELQEELKQLLQLQKLIRGTPKRGRPVKAGGTGTGNPGKRKSKKRGSLSEGILKHLSAKGKEGAHVKDIAAAVGSKPANVTAFAYSAKGKATLKKVKPGTFALK